MSSRQKLGQHWMTSPSAIRAVVGALEISPGDTIVEIGPGKGALTEELRSKNQEIRIIAIEKDGELASALRKKYARDTRVQIVTGDILTVLPAMNYETPTPLSLRGGTTKQSQVTTGLPRGVYAEYVECTRNDGAGNAKFRNSKLLELPNRFSLNATRYKLIGNIPYYITGAIIRLLTTSTAPPERAVLTMQKEVAERLTASPPRMNLLAAIAQASADIKIVKKLPRGAFSPPPKVESAIVRFRNISPYTASGSQYHEFIRQAFAHPRKTLLNNLRPHGAALLAKANLSPKIRAGELSITKLRELARLWNTTSSVDR